MTKLNLQEFFAAEFAEHATVVAATEKALCEPFCRLLEASAKAIRAGNKLLFFGNGGSAADAQHLATELTVRFSKNRQAIAAIALTTDTSALTAIGNDFGFDALFARQVEALGQAGDVAIGISTSGKSPNVLLALEQARKMGLVAAALGGKDGGDLNGLADPLLIVPSDRTSRIQEMHITLGQMLCSALEQELGLV
ncbi:MAG: D-sedoheptulose 7-phosphate isomerase [Alphaproteobacteria bacterium]|nr:D-sedoheptulose 7-phosphate isomerase [Alphaproteobacteria bacterium]